MISINTIITGVGETIADSDYHEKTLPFLSIAQSNKGEYSIALGKDETQKTESGGFFVAPPNVLQRIAHHPSVVGEKMFIRWIFMDVKVNQLWDLSHFYELPVIISAKDGKRINDLFDELEAAKDDDDILLSAIKNQICFGILYDIMKLSKPIYKVDSHKILPALKILERDFMDEPQSCHLASACGVSESYFLKLFKNIMGISPKQYIKMQKLKHGLSLLLDTDKSISQISEELGFYDQFHFCREFKKMYGLSPFQYKKSLLSRK